MVGAVVVVFPFAAGLGVLFDPLRRKSKGETEEDSPAATAGGSAKFVPVCPLDDLPADGLPRRFTIITDVVDAWTRRPSQPIGAVYLTRTDTNGEPRITAFTTACPHLGCDIEFVAGEQQFQCPCHKSGFSLDGTQVFGPSKRSLDSLDVKLAPRGEQLMVWVDFQRFRTGIDAKEPIA